MIAPSPLLPRSADGEAEGDGNAGGVGGTAAGVATQDGLAVPDVAVPLPMNRSPTDSASVTAPVCPLTMSRAAWHCHSTVLGVPVCASKSPVTTLPYR